MQIFRVSQDHDESAAFLDNRRLSKQILELYQIIRVCLAKLDIIEGNTQYLNHPIVSHVFNDGMPYLFDALNLLNAMNEEHLSRGGKRSESFKQDLSNVEEIIMRRDNNKYFSKQALPPIYVYKDARYYGEAVFNMYESLLYYKWQTDTVPPRCGIHRDF